MIEKQSQEKLVRLQFEISQEEVEILDEMVKLTGSSNRKEYVNFALSLAEQVVRTIKEGESVGKILADGSIAPFIIPQLVRLTRVKKAG